MIVMGKSTVTRLCFSGRTDGKPFSVSLWTLVSTKFPGLKKAASLKGQSSVIQGHRGGGLGRSSWMLIGPGSGFSSSVVMPLRSATFLMMSRKRPYGWRTDEEKERVALVELLAAVGTGKPAGREPCLRNQTPDDPMERQEN